MLFAVFFAFWRFMQIVTLIPTMGMLAYFVDYYNKQNALTPTSILVLFIVSVIALAWCIYTLFSYHRSSANATFVAIFDLLFVGAFIGAVWALREAAYLDCTSVRADGAWVASFGSLGSVTVTDWDVDLNKPCAMLKACFAFGIMNCVFFFFTSILAWMHGDGLGSDKSRGGRRGSKTYVRETHYHRHGHRSSRSPHSRHSSHSNRRAYYV
ncbi:hypothetical protein F4778DRAFT_201477 [Xylariomycetidae sp. FL2044]|nr:hypothetical protein F4778DRAFT_201477 [Xylariomycetidae sp. FL2044]